MKVNDYKVVWYDGDMAGTEKIYSIKDEKEALKDIQSHYSDLEILKIELVNVITTGEMLDAIVTYRSYTNTEERNIEYSDYQIKEILRMEDFLHE